MSKRILAALNDPALPEETIELIRGWLVDGKHREEKEKLLLGFFEEKFKTTTSPSKKAYDTLPAILARIGCRMIPLYRRPLRYRMEFRVAAVMLPIVILLGVAAILFTDSIRPEKPAAIQYVSAEATDSTIRQVVLPCGTKIELNRGSRIIYAEETFSQERSVYLTGEAYFDVMNTGIPFLVRTEDLIVRVLGTKFNLKSPADDTITEVMLYTGLIEVIMQENESVIIHPSEQLTYNHETGTARISDFDADIVSEWRTTIELTNVSLAQAFQNIGDYFNITVIADSHTPGNTIVRGRFYNESLPEVLQILSNITSAFDYRIEEDTVFIYGHSHF